MKLCKKKRNDVVYQQGDLAENIFVLLEGEIKLIKKANLFK
jgi:CRP-like cAMP-binding protein